MAEDEAHADEEDDEEEEAPEARLAQHEVRRAPRRLAPRPPRRREAAVSVDVDLAQAARRDGEHHDRRAEAAEQQQPVRRQVDVVRAAEEVERDVDAVGER